MRGALNQSDNFEINMNCKKCEEITYRRRCITLCDVCYAHQMEYERRYQLAYPEADLE